MSADPEQLTLPSLVGVERPAELRGVTYKLTGIPTEDGTVSSVYLTVNVMEGREFEVFINSKNAKLADRAGVLTLSISRLLRNNVPLLDIADDLVSIVSTTTAHYAGRRYCSSFESRIGWALKQHVERGGCDQQQAPVSVIEET